MQRTIGKVSFDDEELASILKHAKKLEGKSLDEVAALICRPDLMAKSGKGVGGQLLQAWFGLKDNDNRPEPDMPLVRFPDGSIGGVEIKTVPLISRKRGLRIKERCKVTSIDFGGLLGETWIDSRARHKLLSVLFIFYRYAGILEWRKSKVEKILPWTIEESHVKTLIKSDWKRTWDFVNEGRAHEISEGHAVILGACTSGAGGVASDVTQPKNLTAKAKKRSFALKPAFLQTAYEYEKNPEAFESVTLSGKPLSADFKNEIIVRLMPFVGKRLGDIAKKLSIPQQNAKHAASLLVKRVLGLPLDNKRVLELDAAGVKLKTVPLQEQDLLPFEDMSFPPMRLLEFVEEDWKNSEFRAHLDCLLVVPTLGDYRGQAVWDRRLLKPFFWTPSGQDEAGIAKEWRMFQKEVQSGKAAYKRIKGKRVSNLTRASDTKYIHLRPKSVDGTVDDIDLFGQPTQKLCFWLNKRFVQSLIHRHS